VIRAGTDTKAMVFSIQVAQMEWYRERKIEILGEKP